MTAKLYYDNDADLSLLKGKTISILGYGSQGHAHAQNLHDSGCKVIVGQRPGSANYDLAVSHGFKPVSVEEATEQGDLINMLLPDEVQGDIYKNNVRPKLKPGKLLMCSHGFNVHFGQVEPPQGVDIGQHLAQQADVERVGRAHPLAPHDQVLGPAQADQARQPLGPAAAGDHPLADLR